MSSSLPATAPWRRPASIYETDALGNIVVAVYHLFDLLQFRLDAPPSHDVLDWLERHCRSVTLRRGRYLPQRPWRLIITLPKPEALRFLAQQDWWLNRIEVTAEIIGRDAFAPARIDDFFTFHLMPRWPGKFTMRRFVNRTTGRHTTYTRARGRGMLFAWYIAPSKLTGEVDCLRAEARLSGANAIRKAGLSNAALLDFDHERFWTTRVPFKRIDVEQLGRCYDNWWTGRRRQMPDITTCGRFSYNHDIAKGNILWSVMSLLPSSDDAVSVRSAQVFMHNLRRFAKPLGWSLATTPFAHAITSSSSRFITPTARPVYVCGQ